MEFREDLKQYAKLIEKEIGYIAGQIEVTTRCYQHCMGCDSWRDRIHYDMEWMQIVQLIVGLCNAFPTLEHITLTGGDPQKWVCLRRFLRWYQEFEIHGPKPRLQVSTAFARDLDEDEIPLWRYRINVLRVSLDAWSTLVYQKIRGDNKNKPWDIVNRCRKLQHRNLAFIITLYPENIDEIENLVQWLNDIVDRNFPVRRLIIMAGMGERGGTSEEYWEKWNKYKEAVQSKYEINTSFNDDIGEVRELCLSKMTDILPCVMNKASFHIKANGDLYPCCLVGGESIKTQEEYKIGNVFAACNSKMEKHLRLLYERPSKVYTPLCKRLCQYKLFQLNLLGAMAKHTTIAIP